MSADVIATRRAEAVRLLTEAGDWDGTALDLAMVQGDDDGITEVSDVIAMVAKYAVRDERWPDAAASDIAADRAALHALALLLAAMTEAP